MVHRGRRPGYEATHVAAIALCRRRDMNIGLRLRIGKIIGTVMAAGTLPNRTDVVHLRRLESREIGMAAIALLRSRDVVGGFSKCVDTVMAV